MRIDWNQYQPAGFYDELFAAPGQARPSAAELANYLASLGARELAERQSDAERAIVEMGITFTVYTEGQNIDRAWPFDVIPRTIEAQEWARIESGLIQRLKVESTVLRNFLRLLVDRHRLAMLPDIARLFRDMADEKAGRVRGTVVSAIPLDPQSIRQLESTLSQVVQKQVVLETRVDQEVLGGVSTQVGSVVFDGTLRSQLDDLKRALQS